MRLRFKGTVAWSRDVAPSRCRQVRVSRLVLGYAYGSLLVIMRVADWLVLRPRDTGCIEGGRAYVVGVNKQARNALGMAEILKYVWNKNATKHGCTDKVEEFVGAGGWRCRGPREGSYKSVGGGRAGAWDGAPGRAQAIHEQQGIHGLVVCTHRQTLEWDLL